MLNDHSRGYLQNCCYSKQLSVALLHASHPPAQTCGGEDIRYIYIFLIFPGHPEFWTPLQIPICAPHPWLQPVTNLFQASSIWPQVTFQIHFSITRFIYPCAPHPLVPYASTMLANHSLKMPHLILSLLMWFPLLGNPFLMLTLLSLTSLLIPSSQPSCHVNSFLKSPQSSQLELSLPPPIFYILL